jgi:hypothetical protein
MTDYYNREHDPRLRQLPEQYIERVGRLKLAGPNSRFSIGVALAAEVSIPTQAAEASQPGHGATVASAENVATVPPADQVERKDNEKYDKAKVIRDTQKKVVAALDDIDVTHEAIFMNYEDLERTQRHDR